jgi:hypothetical protein
MRRAQHLLFILAACGGGSHDTPMMDAPSGDGSGSGSGSAGCPRVPGADDKPRHVVVSHPYDDNGNGAPVFEVLDLSSTGELTRAQPPRTFMLAKRASFGTVEFTPDGQIGVVALEDGSVGAFALADDGTVTVTEPGLHGAGYIEKLVMSPDGDRVWGLDPDTVANHGGVYELGIRCDGTLEDHGAIVTGDVPRALVLDGAQAVLAARSVFDQTPGTNDVHLLDWSATPALVASADAFPGTGTDGLDAAIVGGAAATSDGAFVLIGDTAAVDLSNTPNRVAVVSTSAGALTPVTVLSPLEDPEAIVTSPFGHVAIASSAFGDALFVIDDQGGWRIRGQVTYTGGRPQLPGDMVELRRGAVRGHVFVSENVAIRHLVFHEDGSVEDLGTLAFGDGLSAINGVIGATP